MLYTAFAVGMYGYLFPGNINTLMLALYQRNRYYLLLGILLLALLFEFAYCYVSISFYTTIAGNRTVTVALKLAGCIIGLILGYWILLEKAKPGASSNNKHVTRGIISIVLHPQQITYWLFIYALLSPLGVITSVWQFALFNVLGCALIFTVYIWFGSKLVTALRLNERAIQKMIGVLYVSSSFWVIVDWMMN